MPIIHNDTIVLCWCHVSVAVDMVGFGEWVEETSRGCIDATISRLAVPVLLATHLSPTYEEYNYI